MDTPLETQFMVPHLLAPTPFQSSVINAGLGQLNKQQAMKCIWDHDASLWKSDAASQAAIKNRLGWLTVSNTMQAKLDEINQVVAQVRQAGYKNVVLLGMGGSSLCPEVLRLTFGVADGYLNLFVLDTTDPDTVHSIEQQIDLKTTLFIVASKSGGTVETLSHYTYFFDRVARNTNGKPGDHFIAITDPGTSLEKLAQDHEFRHTFTNPADIGGRYSALSFFGLVPGALMGVNIEQLLARAQAMMTACSTDHLAQNNPSLWLGTVLGTLGKEGHTKITLVLSPEISSYGSWLEQLLAESTGKEGLGLLPVEGEQLGTPEVYNNDRLFVYLRLQDGNNAALDRSIQVLEAAHQPIVRIDLQDRYDLGAEFFRWELATATTGFFLGINPFDEPNVQESKDNTKRLLNEYQQQHQLPEPTISAAIGNIQIYGDENGKHTFSDYLHTFLSRIHAGDYIAIMAYVQHTDATEAALQALRTHLRDTYKVATTVGYGPRFLHSTGQLHKGGANNGVFIQVTGDIQHEDIAIPGEPYSFGVLKSAQALGDLFSLKSHQRRVIRVHISGNIAQGLQDVRQAV